MTSIDEELRELERMSTGELVAKYIELTGKEPRRKFGRHLKKRLAWLLQEREFGGISSLARKRIEELQAEFQLDLEAPAPDERVERNGLPGAGTTLEREWNGRLIRVHVLGRNHFEHDGERYSSLSAIATAITGTRWNGRRFFGLPARARG